MAYRFSRHSREALATVHPELQRLAELALQIKDFKVLEGGRSYETQLEYMRRGVSKTLDSRHCDVPARAFDFLPFIDGKPVQFIPGRLTERDLLVAEWAYMAGVMRGIAHAIGIPLRPGCDWNRDGNITDTNFHDWGHVELPRDWERFS